MQIYFITPSTLIRICLLPLILLSYFHTAQADTDSYVKELQNKATELKLWTHREWINLLHYDKDGNSEQLLSQVDDVRFFNAEDGKNNPQAELLQTLDAFFSTVSNDDTHPQCKFVARFNWLRGKLGINLSTLPKATCKDYKQWRALVPDEQVTLVFPAYHLNSPSSMFGHTLLRLDPAKDKMSSDWLSMAVNFGANVREGDNSLFYAFKGLSGGYPGFFIVTPYFKKIKEYNRKEKRDIWEYPLDLTPEETKRMVTHLWELKEIEFDYYFFDENCSYRLLELLEVARPSIELTDDFELSAIPVDTVRSIQRSGMITDIHYRPSQVTVLEYLLKKIPPKNIDLVESISKDHRLINSDEFKTLSDKEKILILDTSYKYLRFQQTDTARNAESSKNSHKLLEALNAYPIQKLDKPPVPSSHPEQSHDSKRAAISFGQENRQRYSELAFRFSFHSLEDNEHGFLQGAQINMGNIVLRDTENENPKLQRFDVIDIFSLTARTQFFKPMSWKIYTGLERQLTFGQQRIAAHVTGGAGVAYKPFGNNLVYGLLMLRLERNHGFDRDIVPAYGLSSGMLHHFGSSTAHIEISGEEFRNDVYRYRGKYTHNFNLAKNHSLKFTVTREKQDFIEFTEAKLSYQYYFF
jgi:Domain of unknown function (DUF4105)